MVDRTSRSGRTPPTQAPLLRAGCTSSRAQTARSCGRSRARWPVRTSASMRSESATRTTTARSTCSSARRRATTPTSSPATDASTETTDPPPRGALAPRRGRRTNPGRDWRVAVDVPTIRTVKPLLETPLLMLGEFRCPPEDDAWREMNTIGDRPHVVFPRTTVLIEQEGRPPVLATPAHAMLYNAQQLYRRGLRTDVGDDAVFVALPPESPEPLAAAGARLVNTDTRLVASHAPADRRTYLLQHLLVRYLRGPHPDPLLAEEAAGSLILRTLGSADMPRTGQPGRSKQAHRELAEAAKAELA